MRYGCTISIAAVFVAGLIFTSAAEAACNPRNPTACASNPQPQAAAPQAAPQAAAPQAAAPLQLKRFTKLGPARRSVSRSARRHNRHVAHRSRTRKEAAPAARDVQAKVQAPASQDTSAPVTPKSVPTVSIPAPALALAPTTADRTVGFAAATEPWTGGSFADTDDPAMLPPGVTIPRWDEVNAIDLAADENASQRAGSADLTRSVSLVTRANASTRSAGSAASTPKTGTSWLSWLYEKVFDGALAAVLAIRSMFA